MVSPPSLNDERVLIKNTLFIPLAKIYFIITGYGIYFGLTRILETWQFGIYGVVIGLISVINMVFITGTVQGVSKFISEDEDQAESIKRTALIMQCILSGIVFILLNIFSHKIAGWLNDVSLAPFISISSLIFLFYSYYAVFIGHLNGIRDFKRQGGLDMCYSTLKIIMILSMAYFISPLYGAISGFACASALILIIALFLVGNKPAKSAFPMKKLFDFTIIVMIFTLVQELIMHSDLFLLKALSEKAQSNINAGLYTASLSIARIPFMIMISLNYIVFPAISKATKIEEKEVAKQYIYQSLRICLILSILFTVLIASSSRDTLMLLYPVSYAQAGCALAYLSFGYLFFSVFNVSTAVLTSSGNPLYSLILGIIMLIFQIIFNVLLIPRYGINGAACATATAQMIGLIVAGMVVYKKFGVFIPFANILRVSAVAAIIYVIALSVHFQGIFLIIKNIILIVLFVLLMLIVREVSINEIRDLKKILISDK